jgi:hypothetical protein
MNLHEALRSLYEGGPAWGLLHLYDRSGTRLWRITSAAPEYASRYRDDWRLHGSFVDAKGEERAGRWLLSDLGNAVGIWQPIELDQSEEGEQ